MTLLHYSATNAFKPWNERAKPFIKKHADIYAWKDTLFYCFVSSKECVIGVSCDTCIFLIKLILHYLLLLD